jgi:hypothetical protein
MIKYILVSTAIVSVLFSCTPDAPSENNLQQSEVDSTYYLDKGQELTQATFDTLSKTLQNAIAERGIAGAIEFCNIEALPITDSKISQNVWEIKRTSLKVRNPLNEPNEFEQHMLAKFHRAADSGGELNNELLVRGDTVHFFRPIKLMPLCANCHGNKDLLQPDVLAKLNELYPNDKATGYSPGDLRGMWHVKFGKFIKGSDQL